jgi:hypothetical protein
MREERPPIALLARLRAAYKARCASRSGRVECSLWKHQKGMARVSVRFRE